jgi:hypothetical protein
MLFDLPEPLGPMMEVKYESPKESTCLPRYVLKSARGQHWSRIDALQTYCTVRGARVSPWWRLWSTGQITAVGGVQGQRGMVAVGRRVAEAIARRRVRNCAPPQFVAVRLVAFCGPHVSCTYDDARWNWECPAPTTHAVLAHSTPFFFDILPPISRTSTPRRLVL